MTLAIADLDRTELAGIALLDADARSVASNGRYSPWDLRAGAIRAISGTNVVANRDVLEELIEDVTARAIAYSTDLVADEPDKPPHIKALMAKTTVLLKMRVWNRFAELSAPERCRTRGSWRSWPPERRRPSTPTNSPPRPRSRVPAGWLRSPDPPDPARPHS